MTPGRTSADVVLLLDANCLIYYCQRFDETIHGIRVALYHPLSDRVVEAITPIIPSGSCIGTTSAILSEIPNKGAEELVDDFIYHPQILRKLSEHGIIPLPPRIVERWQGAFIRKFKKLRANEWFKEIPFTPSEARLEEAEAFYASLSAELGMAEHLARKGHQYPSKEDLGLALCAKQIQVPILSNDGDFTKFVEAWSRFGVTIRPLV